MKQLYTAVCYIFVDIIKSGKLATCTCTTIWYMYNIEHIHDIVLDEHFLIIPLALINIETSFFSKGNTNRSNMYRGHVNGKDS